MSAVRSLSGGKQTWRGLLISVAFDPKLTWDLPGTALHHFSECLQFPHHPNQKRCRIPITLALLPSFKAPSVP